MRRISRLIPLLLFAFAFVAFEPVAVYAAPKKTDAQIDEQKNALKKLEVDLAKKREELAVLETEEKGVLNTISLLDQNLNRTRSYLSELSRNEDLLQGAVKQLVMDIDSLDAKIKDRKRAMKKRIRNLYVQGRSNDAEILFELLTKNGNPEREVYWVHHLLNRDRENVEMLRKLVAERSQKQQTQEKHLAELSRLRSRKAIEERGLVAQMNGQERMLNSLKHDKAVQRMALKEFERNLSSKDFDFSVADSDMPEIVVDGIGFVYAPVIEMQDAGIAYVCLGNNVVGKIPLVYGETIEEKREESQSFWQKIWGGGRR